MISQFTNYIYLTHFSDVNHTFVRTMGYFVESAIYTCVIEF